MIVGFSEYLVFVYEGLGKAGRRRGNPSTLLNFS
jgi:hypothetical protein